MSKIDVDQVWPRKLDNGTDRKGPWTCLPQKTSYSIGFPVSYAPRANVEAEVQAKCVNPAPYERDLILSNYATNYIKNYDWKYAKNDPLNKADLPAFRNHKFMNYVDEKYRANTTRQIDRKSEYTAKYQNYDERELKGKFADQSSQVLCPVKGIARDDQIKINVASGGSTRLLDIYVSQNKMDFVHHTLEQSNKYKNVGNYITPAFPPKSIGNKIKGEIVKKEYRPFRKCCSETKASYTTPICLPEVISECKVAITPASKGAVLAVPGMYHTEYSHIGRNWPIGSIVN